MPSQAKAAPKAHRRSLADLAASPLPSVMEQAQEAPTPISTPSPATPGARAKYPSATIYLPPRAIRLLKEISLEENRRLTDILAEALNEWLVRKGHPSLEQLGQ